MSSFQVCAFNRTVEKVDHFLANEAKGTKVIGAHSLEEMVSKLKKPRRVMLLVKAGAAVDAFIDKLVRAVNTSILQPLYWNVNLTLPILNELYVYLFSV